MALLEHARQTRKRWKDAVVDCTEAQIAQSRERKRRQSMQVELTELQNRVKDLEDSAKQLKKWEDRKPVINHYLQAVSLMAR